jgi:amidohydrolase
VTTAELRTHVTKLSGELLDLSHRIHADPEVRFTEYAASAKLIDFLTGHGFSVNSGVGGLPTAFRAWRAFGSGGPTIAVFCEYDALPGIGHACGHNIIAAAGAGAAVAAAGWLDEHGGNGRIVVLGSPGEEGGGGKVTLVEAGQLADVDAAVMVHPAGFDAVSRTNLGRVSLEATFTGRASHAAAAPELGRNALDAATLLLVAIGLLRQQLRDGSRVHANVVDGGDSINVIPEHARVSLFIRSTDAEYLRGRLYEAVRDCVAGAALATGTTGSLDEVAIAYEPVRTNPVLASLAVEAFEALGRPIDPVAGTSGPAGSTDMGNVSQVVPAIHPYIRVDPGLAIHTREFAAAAAGAGGDQAVLDGATMLASVVTALITRPSLVADARAAFEEGRE